MPYGHMNIESGIIKNDSEHWEGLVIGPRPVLISDINESLGKHTT